MLANLSNEDILDRLTKYHPQKINLSLSRIKRLLNKLGKPQEKIPPVIHVAGTNGKGSVVAYLKSIAEAAGLGVHTYISPHLKKFNERIVIGGIPASNSEIYQVMEECEAINGNSPITFFEITTAIAFVLFSRYPADLAILETGLGGRLDATNVVETPQVTVLTSISLDHKEYLGEDICDIAREKAAIMRRGVSCVVSLQKPEVNEVIKEVAAKLGSTCFYQEEHWSYWKEGNCFHLDNGCRKGKFRLPNLLGEHQIQNAAQAITSLDNARIHNFKTEEINEGLRRVEWSGRLQRLKYGPIFKFLPSEWEIWLDGGHNIGSAEVLMSQLSKWQDKPLYGIFGMLAQKEPEAIIDKIGGYFDLVSTVSIQNSSNTYSAIDLSRFFNQKGVPSKPVDSIKDGINEIVRASNIPSRIIIMGSLSLVGEILEEHG
ncbi:MAG: Folylpolyglutamate synthase [Alphaproteobacteria bacterium MarineAlpha3_Bin7]|nr:MAG: Folylpolyglutamate synthase [Alphaproteobacteria bacterium MarineAlpha3_Bin7]|tara:strand:- start:120 stop:1412 length:1293 start_codon:yes stop_codon:yes gene_type:complete